MHRRIFIGLIFLVLICAGCSFPSGDQDPAGPASDSGSQDPALVSQQKCGDSVCDGPETAENCPDDCALVGEDQQADPDTPNNKSETPTSGAFGEVYLEISVQRDSGVGTCGSPPWGVDHIDGGDFYCVPPKYWYEYDLRATALQRVAITPLGEGRWEIKGTSGGGGTYQTAEHSSDGERICAPKAIVADVFDFNVEGSYQNESILISMTALPVESSEWQCDNGNSYVRETTLLYLDWAIAMSGDSDVLEATLNATDSPYPGHFSRTYTADLNPSPENRDHVEVLVEFTCQETSEDGSANPVACPWESR